MVEIVLVLVLAPILGQAFLPPRLVEPSRVGAYRAVLAGGNVCGFDECEREPPFSLAAGHSPLYQ